MSPMLRELAGHIARGVADADGLRGVSGHRTGHRTARPLRRTSARALRRTSEVTWHLPSPCVWRRDLDARIAEVRTAFCRANVSQCTRNGCERS
eukprot:2199116-Rhodomonas_salina.1